MEQKTLTRTRNNHSLTVQQEKLLKVFTSSLIGRAELMSKLGMSYSDKRDLYEALGYKTDLTFEDYYTQYDRQDIAKAIIDRPVNATWQGSLELVESNEPEDTDFEKAWKDLNRKLGIKTRLARADRLTGIGQYGVLLLGLDDAGDLEAYQKPVREGARKLLYVKPFSEKTAPVSTFEQETTNVRYGMPLLYNISVEAGDTLNRSTKLVQVHYSRLIHIVDGNLESEIVGIPRLKAVFNRLMDIEKIVGGDAEMFWRGARPGFKGKTDPDYTLTPAAKEALLDQLDEYEHNLRRFLINEGIDVEALVQQIADPSSHVETQLKMISAETGIPLRILTGSERGELASSEDRGEWLTYVQTRREEHAEPHILRPFVDRLIELQILPTPEDDYTVKWADLFSVSEKARVEIGKGRANAIREYTTNPIAQALIPPTVFMMKCLGFTSDEVELVDEIREDEMMEEVEKMAKVKKLLEPEPEPGRQGGPTRPSEETGAPRRTGGTTTRRRRPAI